MWDNYYYIFIYFPFDRKDIDSQEENYQRRRSGDWGLPIPRAVAFMERFVVSSCARMWRDDNWTKVCPHSSPLHLWNSSTRYYSLLRDQIRQSSRWSRIFVRIDILVAPIIWLLHIIRKRHKYCEGIRKLLCAGKTQSFFFFFFCSPQF